MQVNGASSSTNQTQTDTVRKANDTLDKHDFLRLLTVQLRYQDPIDPIKDQDFIAQMAQFTSLEQMQNLSDKMEQFIDMQITSSSASQAASLIGRTVAAYDQETGSTIEGIVESVRFDTGGPLLTVGDRTFTIGAVYEIRS